MQPATDRPVGSSPHLDSDLGARVRAAQTSALLADCTRALLTAEAPEKTIQMIAEKVMAHLDCDVFFNYVIDDARAGMRLNAYAGIDSGTADRIRHLEIGAAVCGCVAAEAQRMIVTDVQRDGHARTGLIRSLGVQAYACHPLLYKDEVIGTLSFGSAGRTEFCEADIELMRVVTDHAATAMARKRYEERLQALARDLEAQAKSFAAFMAAVPDYLFTFDREGRFAFANKALLDLWGLSADEAIGKTMAELGYDPGVETALTDAFQHVFETGEPVRLETVYTNPRGERGFYDNSLAPISNEAGQVALVAGASKDISESRRAQDDLVRSEERYRTLFTNLTDGFALHELVVDDDGRPVDYIFIEVNEAFEQLTGLRSADIIGKRATQVIPGIESDPADWIGRYGRVALTGEPWRFEQRSEALQRWYSVSAYCPEPGRFVALFSDISARRAAEDALRENEERLRKERREISAANRILELFVRESGESLYDNVLDVLLEETASRHGVFGYMDEHGDLVCPTMSRIFDECEMSDADKCVVYKQHKWTGLWGRALREKRTLYSNEEGRVPEGHVPMLRVLATPILFEDEVIGLVHLANKDTDYTLHDVEFLEAICTHIAPVLYARIQREILAGERRVAHARTVKQNEIQAGTNAILKSALTAQSESSLGEAALEVAQRLTGSEFGFIGELGSDGLLHDIAMTDPGWDQCALEDKSGHRRPPADLPLSGLYGRVLSTGEPLLANDPASHADAVGTPEGHPRLTSFLGVPLVADGATVGLVALGNKADGYDEEDRRAVEVLVPAIIEAFRRIRAETALRESRADLARAQQVAHVGSWRIDAHDNMEWSDELYRMWGIPGTAEVTYEDFVWRVHPDDREFVVSAWASGVETGEYDIEFRIEVEGRLSWIHARAKLAYDSKGRFTGAFGTAQDITERRERTRLTELLNEAASAVSATFDPEEIFGILTAKGAEALGVSFAAAAVRGSGFWVIQAVAGAVPDRLRPGSSVNEAVLPLSTEDADSARPVVIEDTAEHPAGGRLNAEGVRAALMVPVSIGGGRTGVLAFCKTSIPSPVTPAQFEFASKLMSVATVALESAHLYERERLIADTLQEAILALPPDIPHFEAAYVYRPASSAAMVGGDFYDLFELGDGRAAVLVGDVSGKGIEAARLTTLMRDGARAYLMEDSDPARVFERLNTLAYRFSDLGSFATAFLAVIDPTSGVCRYAGAGHPAGMLVRPKGIEPLESRSSFLGAFDTSEFFAEETKLDGGDVLVLYTDGVTEARGSSGELFGEDRLQSTCERLSSTAVAQMPHEVLDAVLDYSDGELRDDIIVLCLALEAG